MDPKMVEILDVFAPYATPLVVALATLYINRNLSRSQRREERIRDLEAKLRDDRLEIYRKIIEPYILIFSKDQKFYEAQKYRSIKNRIRSLSKEEYALEISASVDYREAGFWLALFGSDSVVRAFNTFMQYASQNRDVADLQKSGKSHELLKLMGEFLLEIRKSVGNETTDLKYHEMFSGFVFDIEKLAEEDKVKSST